MFVGIGVVGGGGSESLVLGNSSKPVMLPHSALKGSWQRVQNELDCIIHILLQCPIHLQVPHSTWPQS